MKKKIDSYRDKRTYINNTLFFVVAILKINKGAYYI